MDATQLLLFYIVLVVAYTTLLMARNWTLHITNLPPGKAYQYVHEEHLF